MLSDGEKREEERLEQERVAKMGPVSLHLPAPPPVPAPSTPAPPLPVLALLPSIVLVTLCAPFLHTAALPGALAAPRARALQGDIGPKKQPLPPPEVCQARTAPRCAQVSMHMAKETEH